MKHVIYSGKKTKQSKSMRINENGPLTSHNAKRSSMTQDPPYASSKAGKCAVSSLVNMRVFSVGQDDGFAT